MKDNLSITPNSNSAMKTSRIVMRNCVTNGRVGLDGGFWQSIELTNCLFLDLAFHSVVFVGKTPEFRLRRNVFSTKGMGLQWSPGPEMEGRLWIERNSVLTKQSLLQVWKRASGVRVTLTGNVVTSLAHVHEMLADDEEQMVATWTRRGNVYFGGTPENKLHLLPSTEDRVFPGLIFESDIESESFGRLLNSSDSDRAVLENAGAVQPGPAPGGGD